MNPEIKSEWTAALRSGEYKQGKGCLRSEGDKFCCLGVLTDLYAKAVGGQWVEARESKPLDFIDAEGAGTTSYPTRAVQDWAGLPHGNPFVIRGLYGERSLATLNDDGVPFSDIADLIEEQL